jgi:hypothetical protein
MDRNIVYPGSIPLDTDLLETNRNAMVALGALMRAVLGTQPVIDGLAVSPTVPASMAIQVAPGSITQLATVDAGAYGSLPAEAGAALVKMGINLEPATFDVSPPSTSGQSVTHLVEAAFQEADVDPVVLPYYNAANPAAPYLGPANSGAAQNTRRVQRVQLQVKFGVPAATGTQVAPAVDAGWVGLATVTVAHGQASVTGADIMPLFTAPVLPFRLPELRPGFSNMQAFAASGSFVVPQGVTRLRVRAIGGGGGGGGGGHAEGIVAVGPGQVIAVSIGAGGAGGVNNSGSASGNSGANGGTTSFGAFLAAAGGSGGQGSLSGGQGNSGPGGAGSGGAANMVGSAGNAGFAAGSGFGGHGGAAAAGGGGGAASSGLPSAGAFPGGGGAGGGGNFAGAPGAPGLVIVEF